MAPAVPSTARPAGGGPHEVLVREAGYEDRQPWSTAEPSQSG